MRADLAAVISSSVVPRAVDRHVWPCVDNEPDVFNRLMKNICAACRVPTNAVNAPGLASHPAAAIRQYQGFAQTRATQPFTAGRQRTSNTHRSVSSKWAVPHRTTLSNPSRFERMTYGGHASTAIRPTFPAGRLQRCEGSLRGPWHEWCQSSAGLIDKRSAKSSHRDGKPRRST